MYVHSMSGTAVALLLSLKIHNYVCTCDLPACSIQWVHSIPPLRTIIYSKSSLLGTGAPIKEHCWANTLVILRWAILQHSVSTQSLSQVTVASYSLYSHSRVIIPHSHVTQSQSHVTQSHSCKDVYSYIEVILFLGSLVPMCGGGGMRLVPRSPITPFPGSL